jgi:hydrogenase nickel incorporation protein HypA/HybF
MPLPFFFVRSILWFTICIDKISDEHNNSLAGCPFEGFTNAIRKNRIKQALNFNMHELSITQGILDIAISKAKEVESKKVLQIDLVIGEASSVIDDCIQFYFDIASRGTMAEGAKLNFNRKPLKVKCRDCGTEFNPGKEAWECPQCGKWDIQMTGGMEFYMESIEVE